MQKILTNKKILAKTNIGFTLVELLVAISILSLSILATFTAVSSNLKGSNFSEDQIIAYYLSDEAIEYIINLRGANGIANIQALPSGGSMPWLTGIANASGDACYNGQACKVDSQNNTLTSCGGNCPAISIDANGKYGYTGGTATGFTRTITVVPSDSNREALITVTVSWTTNGISKSYVLKEMLRNWQ